ncbi:methionine biosynthesis protein MetW [Hydrogenophilus thermoluteolus]|uniref:Methionine biosynthesis protein MetW n=1 Tax=Hydrogenophilus thermoluteolus TaxID=297 RepID=A0A2Z6E0X2_HYDTE|nr:methionine biosynthesis protein MetW [Hydrogenophilus thermoluteolus]BBD78132.1 methionine biosynthesis protein MetW [Hydrogenophilus thermoluteolus]
MSTVTTPATNETAQPESALRFDLAAIARWVQPEERVLDLGCGDGALLAYLSATKRVVGYGIENDVNRVIACLDRGVNVIQSNLDQGLAGFEDGFFDRVIMSQALQAMHNTQGILQEMLRVGREAVVSFPNFAFWKHRKSILEGRMPVSESLPHQWFNTPNIRFFTVADFTTLCDLLDIEILEWMGFDDQHQPLPPDADLNFLATLAIARLARR